MKVIARDAKQGKWFTFHRAAGSPWAIAGPYGSADAAREYLMAHGFGPVGKAEEGLVVQVDTHFKLVTSVVEQLSGQ